MNINKWKFWKKLDTGLGWKGNTTSFDREIVDSLHTSFNNFQRKIYNYNKKMNDLRKTTEHAEFIMDFLEETHEAKKIEKNRKQKALDEMQDALQKEFKMLSSEREEFQREFNSMNCFREDILKLKEHKKSVIEKDLELLLIHGFNALKNATEELSEISTYLSNNY
ncbi:hypothetical protein COV13_02850 [Candidatus Woesearchaeota archaeon CG10_big_fil_rev_8_21_14_0_10_32_9]|nr:MAG: hypothetical protein COV13_02850 [Candidatus Woesearchaeota archaeon CG10_big_fil_rev_8_21_14_0_10_32_9]